MPDTQASPLDPISAVLMALNLQDPALGTLAQIRDSFGQEARVLWDVGISRYLKLRYEDIVTEFFGGDHEAASRHMDVELGDYDLKETVHRACALSSDPLMMEAMAYAMALAAVKPGQLAAWRNFCAVIDHLYKDVLVPA